MAQGEKIFVPAIIKIRPLALLFWASYSPITQDPAIITSANLAGYLLFPLIIPSILSQV